MNRLRARVVPSLLLAAAALNCSPDMEPGAAGTAGSPGSSGETLVIQPMRVHAATPPTGAFRTIPPADADQVIRVFMDEAVVINGARFSPADPNDELKVEVEW